jgi:hypothetical protein
MRHTKTMGGHFNVKACCAMSILAVKPGFDFGKIPDDQGQDQTMLPDHLGQNQNWAISEQFYFHHFA